MASWYINNRFVIISWETTTQCLYANIINSKDDFKFWGHDSYIISGEKLTSNLLCVQLSKYASKQ